MWFFDLRKIIYRCVKPERPDGPVPVVRRRSGVSDTGSDYDDMGCSANSLYMSLPRKTTALSQGPCKGRDCDLTPILREDHTVSKLPLVFLTEGLNLCKTHRDIYSTLRGNQACTVLECMRLGVSGPEGKNFCPTHMSQAALPPKEPPKVKFGNLTPPDKAPDIGMGSIPDEVSKALVTRMTTVEGMSEPEVACRLADDYGGALLDNALRIYRLVVEKSSSSGDVGTPVVQNRSKPTDPPPSERVKCYSFDPPDIPAAPPVTPKILIGRIVQPPVAGVLTTPPVAPLHVGPNAAVGPVTVAPTVRDASQNNVFANVPRTAAAPQTTSLGTNDALPPTPDLGDPNKLFSPIAFSMDRLANPDISTKPGTPERLKRNEEICEFVARFFNNYHVSLCPGVTGKPLAVGLKALNDRIRPLYEDLDLPCGLTNRICIGAAALTWGCRLGGP